MKFKVTTKIKITLISYYGLWNCHYKDKVPRNITMRISWPFKNIYIWPLEYDLRKSIIFE